MTNELWNKCRIKQDLETWRYYEYGKAIVVNNNQLELLLNTYKCKGLEHKIIRPFSTFFRYLFRHRYSYIKIPPIVEDLYIVCVTEENVPNYSFNNRTIRANESILIDIMFPIPVDENQNVHIFYKQKRLKID